MWPMEDYRRIEAEEYENKYAPVKTYAVLVSHSFPLGSCLLPQGRISDCGALIECHP